MVQVLGAGQPEGGGEEGATAQTLLVPYADRDQARLLGARWDAARRAWTTTKPNDERLPRRWLPLRNRPGVTPPFIRINLVPQTSWGRNVRAMMTREEWAAFVKPNVYATTGSLCLVCGERGPMWPVEADEVWQFDDDTGVQRLAAIVPLCPGCHLVRTAGHAIAKGMRALAVDRLSWIERISLDEASHRIDEAMVIWQRRSRRKWTVDISLMKDRYGLDVAWDGAAADEANARLVSDARRQRGRHP